jgi:hypothetical protein
VDASKLSPEALLQELTSVINSAVILDVRTKEEIISLQNGVDGHINVSFTSDSVDSFLSNCRDCLPSNKEIPIVVH